MLKSEYKSMKKKIILLILFIFLGLLILFQNGQAQEIDISYAYFHIKADFDNQSLLNNLARGYIYLSAGQAALLVERSENIKSPTIEQLTGSQNSYFNYLKEKIKFYNNNQLCEPASAKVSQMTEEEIQTSGLQIIIDFQCPQPITNIKIINQIFIDEFEWQTNYVYVLEGPEKTTKGAILYKQDPVFTLNFENADKADNQQNKQIISVLKRLVDKLSNDFNGAYQNSLLLVLIMVFLLGLLHALETSHRHINLTDYLFRKKARLKNSLSFAIVSTFVHITNIIVLGLILLVVNSFTDIFLRLPFLKSFSLYVLLFISIYLFFKNIAYYLQHKFKIIQTPDYPSQSLPNKNIVLNFITGLSPCIFDWSIFMIILSFNKIWSIFPVIFSFALGIFAGLIIITILINKLKHKFFNKNQWLALISPVLSSLILFSFALIILGVIN